MHLDAASVHEKPNKDGMLLETAAIFQGKVLGRAEYILPTLWGRSRVFPCVLKRTERLFGTLDLGSPTVWGHRLNHPHSVGLQRFQP